MLSLLHGAPKPTARLESRDVEAEIAETAAASDFVQAMLPEEGAMIPALLECAREVYPQLPQEPRTFTHGDLKLEHWWVTVSGLTLMDFDTCRLDDPALDVGTFLADLQICCSLCDRPGAEEAQRNFLEGYSSGALSERLVRARFYEAIELVKMTVRRVQLSDPAWTSQTEKLVRLAQLVMERLRETLGLPTKNPLSNTTPQSSTAWEGSVAGKTPRRQARPGAIGDA
jgi:aminoglycoside phosphotransferase (APT) family kinase protein